MDTSSLALLKNVDVIVLAAGHGGNDSGATHESHKERDQAIVIVNRMATLLSQRGVTVQVAPHDDDTHESIPWVNERFDFGDAWVIEVHRDSATGLSHDDASRRCGVYYGTSSQSKEVGDFVRDAMKRHGANEKTWSRPDTASRHGSLGWIRQTRPAAHLLELGFMQGSNEPSHMASLSRIAAAALFEAFTGMEFNEDPELNAQAVVVEN